MTLKHYALRTAEILISFYIATFSLAVYFVKGGAASLPLSLTIILLYLFVLFLCVKRLIQTFSPPALMIITPIAPLIALIFIVTMLPLLERLR